MDLQFSGLFVNLSIGCLKISMHVNTWILWKILFRMALHWTECRVVESKAGMKPAAVYFMNA